MRHWVGASIDFYTVELADAPLGLGRLEVEVGA